MSDGQIKISVEVDGRQVDVAADSLEGLEDAGKGAGKGVKETEDGLKGVGDESTKASGNVKKFVTALGLVAVGAAAFKVLRQSMDAAISRFDTLNTFPKVLEALGVSAEDSQKAMSNLSDGIDGLPTKLDEIASTAQRMYTSFGDMDVATESALALNNALLGSGASADQAKRGTDQYLKALQTGKMEMDTWNSLSETMDVGLVKVAESFGFAGKSAKSDLYDALKEGHITMDQFNDKLIEVGTGTGIMAELAKENSLGLATSMQNLRTSVARGVTTIIEKFDELSKEVTGKNIAENIDGLKNIVSASFRVIGQVIEKTTPIIVLFADAVSATVPIVDKLTPAIIGLMVAYGAYAVITKVSAAISASNAILKVAIASTNGLSLATKGYTAAEVAKTGAVKLSTLVIGVMTGSIKLSTAAKVVATAATYAFGAAIRFLTGPVGWVVTGLGALTAATVAVVKWFKRSTEESKRLNAETEELGDSTSALTDEINTSSEAYQQNIKETEVSAKTNKDQAKIIEDLANKENKSAAEKQILNDHIQQLNESVDGLNLAYDEEANALSMSSEEMQARLDLTAEQTSYNEALERQVEISKEQNEIDMQLQETNALREEWNQKLEDGSVKSGEYKDAIEELDEQERTLEETLGDLSLQQAETEEQMTTSMEAITEATESGVGRQKVAFEDLSEAQQSTVEDMKATWEDYKASATDMFDVLNDEIEITASEMAANLEENQRVIGNWADNIATLAERGVDEGLLDTLREAGPESAGHVNALVNASDQELEHLSSVFAEGGDVATNALSKSLGIQESGVMDAVGDLVVDTEKTLREQVNSADFQGIGGDLTDGLADGIKTGTADTEAASRKMAEDTTTATRDAFQTQSPSRVYKEIGGDLTEGLALGINQGTSKVTRAIESMFKTIESGSTRSFSNLTKGYDKATNDIERSLSKLPTITQKAMQNMMNRLVDGSSRQMTLLSNLARNMPSWFGNTPSQFNSIGRNAMSGLNNGLISGRGRVMSTARSIANSVAATMRNALRIKSPSRIFMDIGSDVTDGLTLGIDKGSRNVLDTITKMSNQMVSVSTPEIALGTSSMAYSGGYNVPGAVGGSTSNVTNSPEIILNYHGNDPEDAEEMVNLIDRELENRASLKLLMQGVKR